MTNWDYFFVYISVFSPIIPLCFAMKRIGSPFTIVLLFVVASFTSDYISTFVIIGRNYLFLHAYGLIEALVLLFFFYKVLKVNKWIPIVAILYSYIYIVNSIEFEYNQFNTNARSLESLIMIFLSLKLFHQFFKLEEDISMESSPLFWFNVGLLTYFSGAFFTFIFSEYILDPRTHPLWWFHNGANFLKNVFIAVSLWKIRVI